MLNFVQHYQGPLMVFFFLLAALCLAAATFFAVLMRRAEKKADQRLKQARADITDMTILFQTMRDIIGQQKSLAKEFNEELEHKMEQVKHVLNQGMEKNRQLYDKQQRIAAELEDARAQVDALFRQLNRTPADTASNGPAPQKRTPAIRVNTGRPTVAPSAPKSTTTSILVSTPQGGPKPAPAPQPAPQPAAKSETPQPPRPKPALNRTPVAETPRTPADVTEPMPLRPTPPLDARERPAESLDRLVPSKRPPADARERGATGITAEEAERLSETGVTKAPFTSWVAGDLLEDKAPPRKVAPPRPAPPDPAERGPGNGDAAREAFRALLNMPATPEPPSDPGPLDIMPKGTGGTATGAPEPEEAPELSVPLQQRVLEYSEAGMTVAQVSRELGIGKGEVRLMLSLAKQQSPPGE